MKVPDITEEERAEIFTALRERKENLEKLEKKTQEASVPIDRFEERLALYRDRDELVAGANGSEKHLRPGLLAMYAPTPELSTEALENQQRRSDGEADLWGGGVETGGGRRDGAKEGQKWTPRADGRKKRGGSPETVGDIITPPAPRDPLQLPAVGSPSNADNVIDPTPNRPSDEALADLKQAALIGEESEPDARDELASAASAAKPSGRVIRDQRNDDSTVMGGADIGE